MPFISVNLAGAITREQRAQVVADITRSMVERLGKPAAAVQIAISEYATDSYGAGGILLADRSPPPATGGAQANGSQ